MDKELNEVVEQIGKDWDEFKKSNDARLDKIEKGAGSAELEEKVTKIDVSIQALVDAKEVAEKAAKLLAERLEEAEARFEQGGPQQEGKEKKLAADHMNLFLKAVRSADQGGDAARELHTFVKANSVELKALDTGVGATGGFAVPEEIARDISDQERLLSPVRGMVKVRPIGTSDYKELVNIHGETSGWAGEAGTRSETATPALRQRVPTMGTLYAYPKATEESMDDMFFDVQAWLTDAVAIEFASAEGIAVISGNGTDKPTGLFNEAPVAEADDASPVRDANALELISLDSSSPPSVIDPDRLMDMVYTLRGPYRATAQWAMNSLTQGAVRKLKQNSEYIWTPGLTLGQQPTLLGYGVSTWEDLADLAADSLSILFGAFSRGYLLVDRVGLRLTVDANITTPGQVKFYMRRREGGITLDNNALKVGKFDSA
jgi:HK97 family phage major capsid protein